MRNARGFSLIEVMLVLGVLSVSVFLSAEVMNHMNRSIKYPESKVNLGAITTVIRETLRYQRTCELALSGVTLGPTRELAMRLPGILADGTPQDDLLQRDAIVQQLRITSLRTINTIPLGADRYFAEFEIGATVAATGLALKPMVAGAVYYTATPAGRITSCDTPGVDPTPLCVEMGCKWDPTQTPACQCNPIDLTCPSQQFVTGVTAESKPICTPLGNGTCPAGTYLKGLSIGQNRCEPLVAAAAPTLCGGGSTNKVSSVPAAPSGCYCADIQTWNGSSCI